MHNIKIMVNWKEQKIIHTETHVGTKEYNQLCDKGYIRVGVIKVPEKSVNNIFWDDAFFDPSTKYIAQNIGKITG